MDRKEYAVALKHAGCNCAQAVLCAFAEDLPYTEAQLKGITACFGVGMGTMQATCGALIAAEMLLGMKKYEGRPMLKAAADLHQNFVKLCGASICKDLKGIETGTVLCECDDCVRNAVQLAEERIG